MQVQAQVGTDGVLSDSTSQVFVELLHSARRAGATLVVVEANAVDDRNTHVEIIDNGAAFDDFSNFLYFCKLGWGAKVGLRSAPGLAWIIHERVSISVLLGARLRKAAAAARSCSAVGYCAV
jgi:hypothetical protein